MSRVIPIVVLGLALVAGCRTMDAAASASVADGSTRERAVVIRAGSEMAGIAQEGVWLREHFPGCVKREQSLIVDGRRSYDVVKVEVDGVTHEIWFDITSFLGKW